jgi:hypothetical protein
MSPCSSASTIGRKSTLKFELEFSAVRCPLVAPSAEADLVFSVMFYVAMSASSKEVVHLAAV